MDLDEWNFSWSSSVVDGSWKFEGLQFHAVLMRVEKTSDDSIANRWCPMIWLVLSSNMKITINYFMIIFYFSVEQIHFNSFTKH